MEWFSLTITPSFLIRKLKFLIFHPAILSWLDSTNINTPFRLIFIPELHTTLRQHLFHSLLSPSILPISLITMFTLINE